MFIPQTADPIQDQNRLTKPQNFWQKQITESSTAAGSTLTSARESGCWDTPPKDNSSYEYSLMLTNFQQQRIKL